MSSDYLDSNGNAECTVCKKQKSASDLTLCQGCDKFTCDPGCGSFSHKEGAWLCKKCLAESKK